MFVDLEIFTRVAKAGNMSAVAREMRTSPAVISKRIGLLEKSLGARLFQRTTRQLTLTEAGEGYFKHAVDILSRAAEAEDFVRSCNSKPSGLLRVTVPTTLARLHLAPRLAQFLACYPEIELDLHVTDEVIDIIRESFDIAIRAGELSSSSLIARKLSSDARVICAAPSYLKRAGSPTSLAELANHNCLSPDTQEVWRLEGPDGQHQLRVNGNVHTNSSEIIREALVSGLGIGLRSIWEIGLELESGALTVLLPQYKGSSKAAVYAVYPSRNFRPAKTHAFIEFLAKHFDSQSFGNTTGDLVAQQSPSCILTSREEDSNPVCASVRPASPLRLNGYRNGGHA